jgi:flavodoxin
MTANTLVAYYSMSGNTRAIANEISDALGADIEEIREPRARRGVAGAVRGLVDAVLRRQPPILPIDHDPTRYELLVLGGPVWAGRMAAPVRTFARQHATQTPRIAFFCTEGGHGADTAFADLAHLCQHAPQATLVVDGKHLESALHRAELGHFASCTGRAIRAGHGPREPSTSRAFRASDS